MNSRKRYRSGFTLIEVLLVIGILVALSAVGVVAYSKIKASSDKKQALIQVNDTKRAVEIYQSTMSRLPTDEEGLGALITPPDDEAQAAKWKETGPFLKDGKIPQDPWGRELKYVLSQDSSDASGATFQVYSFGPNGTDDNGGEDDIPNWAAK